MNGQMNGLAARGADLATLPVIDMALLADADPNVRAQVTDFMSTRVVRARAMPHCTLKSHRARVERRSRQPPRGFSLNHHRQPLFVAAASVLALTIAAGFAPQAFAADEAAAPATAKPDTVELNEIVVNGIPYKETVLPTRLSSSSVYGLDLNVMDTPRNTTLLSTTQLATVNIQDPRAFSYLTASSYTDSSFGTPNIPRIRGQYADVFYNGMRLSFTQNGYGAPPNFENFDNISITKGPASVIDGPGPGVGGEVDFITKRPSLSHFVSEGSVSFDTVSNRRWTLDVQGPLIPGKLGFRLSYSGEYSDSYFYSHYAHKNAVYAALRWAPNSRYQLDFNAEVNSQQYIENVGVNRVNQNLIDHAQYLRGAPDGKECFSTFSQPCTVGIPIGSPGNPYSPVVPILTELNLTTAVPFNTRVTIDQAPGVFSQALTFNAQLVQSYRAGDAVTLEDNAFFAYQDSENREPYYYADASLGSWTFENRADAKAKFDLALGGLTIGNEMIAGVTFRFAHVNYISDFSVETPGVFDLTANSNLWVWDNSRQVDLANAFPYQTSFGHTQYGVPGRDSISLGNDGVSDLFDTGLFFQHRLVFSSQFSALYGGRIDLVQNHAFDPLPPGGAPCDNCFTSIYDQPGVPLPQSHTTGVYGLGNGNVSLVYRPRPWVTGYATFDFTQSVNPNGGEGGVNTFLQVADHVLMRSDSFLYEAGLKFNLLNNKLFAGLAGFDQKRSIPTGAGGTTFSRANIRGFEIEANYQPTRNLFATASYSYIRTTLNKAAGFYNYPAKSGLNIDGAGLFAVFKDGQTFDDPGVPQQIFNFLGNYKFSNGLGARFGVQVVGPIATSTSGQLDPDKSSFVPASVIANGFYYKSPVIPWQYSMNASIFYEWRQYTATVSVYNLTDQLNWQSAPTFYGNDFLVRNDPRTLEFRIQAKF